YRWWFDLILRMGVVDNGSYDAVLCLFLVYDLWVQVDGCC
ncbi:hypothetical protein A2U01_0081201, partial [Trifolium medium]|nr:hypothetical protein [Trifolium medium]